MYRSHPCSIVSIDAVHRTLVLSNSGFGEEQFLFQVPGIDSMATWTIHRVTNTDVRLKPGDLPVRPSEWCPGSYLGQEATFLNPERLSNFVIISFLDPRSQETQNGYGNYTSPRAVDCSLAFSKFLIPGIWRLSYVTIMSIPSTRQSESRFRTFGSG
jgi:hypothetical protein